MSTTEEAVASTIDAPVSPPEVQPDGTEPQAGNVAESSPAAKETSDSTEPEVKGVQRRFDELTRARREAERRELDAARERDHWRDLALKSQERPKPLPETQKPKTLADFAFDEGQYHAYLLGEASKAATEAAKRELQTEQEKRAKQEQAASYVQRAKEFAKDHPDYKDIAETAPISDPVAEIIVGLDSGPEVAYYLGKNHELASEISRLPQMHAAFELGQIAARLEIERERAQSAKAIISSAPPPTPRIEGSAPGVAVKASDPASDNLSTKEWLALREKEVRRKR